MIKVRHLKEDGLYEAEHFPTRLAYRHTDRDTAIFELGKLVASQMQLNFDTEENRPGCF